MIYRGLGLYHLAAFRIFLLGFWFVEVGRSSIGRLSAFDPRWFSPHGPWLLLPRALRDSFFFGPGLLALQGMTLVSLAALLLGLRGRAVWRVLVLVLLLLFTGFLRGFGHPDHSHVQALLATFVLLFSPAWGVWTLDGRRRLSEEAGADRKGSPADRNGEVATSFAAMALAFSAPYLATGVYRLAKEGVSLFFGDSMLFFIARDSRVLDDFEYDAGLWLVEHPGLLPLINFSFVLVTVAEIAAPFAHLRKWSCALFLAVILPFHVLSPWLMHILFLPNIVVLVGLYLVPWVLSVGGETPRHGGQSSKSGR